MTEDSKRAKMSFKVVKQANDSLKKQVDFANTKRNLLMTEIQTFSLRIPLFFIQMTRGVDETLTSSQQSMQSFTDDESN